MTQLTLNQYSAFVRRQQQRSLDSNSASETDEGNPMARVRHNSLSGRNRRHDSLQTDSTRTIRPKASSSETHPSRIDQSLDSTPNTWNQPIEFRGIPPPLQLVTSKHGIDKNLCVEAQSSQFWHSSEEFYSTPQDPRHTAHHVDTNNYLSPLEYTPSQSASSERAGSQAGLPVSLSSNRERSDSTSTNFLDRTLHHGKSVLCITCLLNAHLMQGSLNRWLGSTLFARARSVIGRCPGCMSLLHLLQ